MSIHESYERDIATLYATHRANCKRIYRRGALELLCGLVVIIALGSFAQWMIQ